MVAVRAALQACHQVLSAAYSPDFFDPLHNTQVASCAATAVLERTTASSGRTSAHAGCLTSFRLANCAVSAALRVAGSSPTIKSLKSASPRGSCGAANCTAQHRTALRCRHTVEMWRHCSQERLLSSLCRCTAAPPQSRPCSQAACAQQHCPTPAARLPVGRAKCSAA